MRQSYTDVCIYHQVHLWFQSLQYEEVFSKYFSCSYFAHIICPYCDCLLYTQSFWTFVGHHHILYCVYVVISMSWLSSFDRIVFLCWASAWFVHPMFVECFSRGEFTSFPPAWNYLLSLVKYQWQKKSPYLSSNTPCQSELFQITVLAHILTMSKLIQSNYMNEYSIIYLEKSTNPFY